jgi:hypothetical protein
MHKSQAKKFQRASAKSTLLFPPLAFHFLSRKSSTVPYHGSHNDFVIIQADVADKF